ncbi:hypothetical protein EJ110_NYTH23873 [Nymphaea thermarum]|nr:hypothetical protein EJ110_NYTH23873 [Nymphaea thermarum]
MTAFSTATYAGTVAKGSITAARLADSTPMCHALTCLRRQAAQPTSTDFSSCSAHLPRDAPPVAFAAFRSSIAATAAALAAFFYTQNASRNNREQDAPITNSALNRAPITNGAAPIRPDKT